LQEIFTLAAYAQTGILAGNPFTFGGVFTIACPTWSMTLCNLSTGTTYNPPSTGSEASSNPGLSILIHRHPASKLGIFEQFDHLGWATPMLSAMNPGLLTCAKSGSEE